MAFKEFVLPWDNLVSILFDSCAGKPESKSGLEKLMRERKASHLVDIDGDIGPPCA